MPRFFYERFRTEIVRYAEGVHRLGPPAPARAVEGLPEDLASFLRSFDGAELFIDAYTIFPAAGLRHEGSLLRFGETANGDVLALDLAAGPPPPVVRIEEDSGERLVEGTSFARWVEGLVAAEGVIYDREGEYREGVFDETGEELVPAAVLKRERRILKVDPGAPAPSWRMARALHASGRTAEAIRLLGQLTAALPVFGWAHYDLGRLLAAAGRLPEAEEAFSRAAEADPAYEHAGYFTAHAARIAARRGDEPARERHAARALALEPGVARGQRDAARNRLEDGHPEEARELLELAAAVTPRDLEVLDLLRKLGGEA